MSTLWQARWWLVSVGPNVVAAVLCAIPAVALGWVKVARPAIRRFEAHERRTREVHEQVVKAVKTVKTATEDKTGEQT